MNDKMNNYLTTGLLVVAAFVIGMLFTEVRYLKKGGSVATAPSTDTAAVEQLGQNLDAAKNVPPVTADDIVRGASEADAVVTMIEYSDLECPFCKRFHPTMQQVMQEYDGKVRWVFRHYPLSFHANAEPAAQATECVRKLSGAEAAWKFIDGYTEKTPATGTGIAVEDMPKLAADLTGVSAAEVKKCMDSDEMAQRVADQMAGGAAAGVEGTPGTIVVTKDGQYDFISGALPFEGATGVKATLDKYIN